MASESSRSFMGTARNTGRYASYVGSSMQSALSRTQTGAAFSRGVGMTFGFMSEKNKALGRDAWHFKNLGHGYRSTGFLGWRGTEAGKAYTKGFGRALARGEGGLAARTAGMKGFGAAVRAGGLKGAGKAMGSMAFKGLVPAFTLFEIYSGYQRGGIAGAVGAGAEGAAIWGAWEAGGALLGGTALTAAGVVAGGLYASYALGEAAQAHGKRLRHLEMGAPIQDPFGAVATTRQRSLAALQNTHINGRMALGNEGALMHSGAYGR